MTDKKYDKVEDGAQVSVEYTGTLDDGTVFDKSEGRGPLTFVIGKKMMIPGFEQGLLGMKVDEEKELKLKPGDAYGERRDELQQKVPKDQLPKEIEPKEGMMLMLQNPQGQQLPAKITAIGDSDITLDLNHPLAGQNLNFKVKVTEICEPKEGDAPCGPDCKHDHSKENCDC
jgi:peptidylprolyl isomerase